MNTDCEKCYYDVYDETCKEYVCQMNLDEDEMVQNLSYRKYQCRYFRFGDEYSIVRKQI